MNDHRLSFCISGAGPIGLALAVGLGQLNYRVKLLDQKVAIDQEILVDDRRMLALSHRTVEFFKKIHAWEAMEGYATPIDSVHVSQKNCRAEVLMHAHKIGVDHFGFLVPHGRVVLALYEQVLLQNNVELCLGSRLIPTAQLHDAQVTYHQNDQKITEQFDWLIAAEGVDSLLRQNFGIETFMRDYDQIAVIARAVFEKPHKNIAYERFTESGPLALLPVNDREMAVVLIADAEETTQWKKASDLTYAAEILSRIGARLGDVVEVSQRQVWPLKLMLPKKVVEGRLLLAGNSAHGLHPIAGQGLNLGIRDCEAIIELFASQQYPSSEQLAQFNNARHEDILKTVGATDFLVNAFGIQGTMAQTARSLGLFSVKTLPFLKNKIAKMGMGY